MPNYRRVRVAGGSWFFTVNLLERNRRLLTEEHSSFWHAMMRVKRRRPFRIEAMVVLPDHLHAIWTLPDGDSDFPTRWRLIKTLFAKTIEPTERLSEVRIARNERGVWQRRYWEHLIRDDHDFNRHIEYCYLNPCKHGLVSRPIDWPYSTLRRDLRLGRFEPDWAYDALHGIWPRRAD